MGLPEMETVAQELSVLGSVTSAPECHGILCGLVCTNAETPLQQWRDLLQAEGEEQMSDGLNVLFAETLRQLEDEDFGFELLLPDDQVSLVQRAGALADWCAGFGFAAALAARPPESLGSDSAEFLEDVREIASLDIDSATGEGDEAAYAELVEYVRVGALLAYTASRTDPKPNGNEKSEA